MKGFNLFDAILSKYLNLKNDKWPVGLDDLEAEAQAAARGLVEDLESEDADHAYLVDGHRYWELAYPPNWYWNEGNKQQPGHFRREFKRVAARSAPETDGE